ncbi:MAG TPA: hypothetical protein VIA61_16935 [Methylomirabilota bacterium]|jgi:hypothetical protein
MRRILLGLVVVVLTIAGCGLQVTRTPSCNLKEKVLNVVLSTQRLDRLAREWATAPSVLPEIAWADAEAEVSLNSFYFACGEHAPADATGVVDASVRLRTGDLAAVRGTASDAEALRRQFQQAIATYLQSGKSGRPNG